MGLYSIFKSGGGGGGGGGGEGYIQDVNWATYLGVLYTGGINRIL